MYVLFFNVSYLSLFLFLSSIYSVSSDVMMEDGWLDGWRFVSGCSGIWISEAHNSQLQKGTLTVHRQQLFQCNRGFNHTVFHVEVKLNFALFCKEDSVNQRLLGFPKVLSH